MILIATRLGQVIQIIIQVCFTKGIYIYQKFGGGRGGGQEGLGKICQQSIPSEILN